jgi:hypothetical protein
MSTLATPRKYLEPCSVKKRNTASADVSDSRSFTIVTSARWAAQ